MNKTTYFPRFLKVPGEVKPGEVYHSKWRAEHKFYHYCTCAKIENDLIFPTEGAGSDTGFPLSDATKIRAVMCSDDIEIGDRAADYSVDPCSLELLFKGEDIWMNSGGEDISLPNWRERFRFLKIIGDISPKAIPFIDLLRDYGPDKYKMVWKNEHPYVRIGQNPVSDRWHTERNTTKIFMILGPCGYFH